jgi:hypothetical protein
MTAKTVRNTYTAIITLKSIAMAKTTWIPGQARDDGKDSKKYLHRNHRQSTEKE